MEPISVALIGASILLAMGLACVAGLKGWQAWLEYKRLELASRGARAVRRDASARTAVQDAGIPFTRRSPQKAKSRPARSEGRHRRSS